MYILDLALKTKKSVCHIDMALFCLYKYFAQVLWCFAIKLTDDLTDDRPLTADGETTFELVNRSLSARFNARLS